MKRWIAPLGSLVAAAGVAALALFLAGVFDGNDASGSGDTVAPGCEVGYVGVCNDTPIPDGETGDLFEGDGPALQPSGSGGNGPEVAGVTDDDGGDTVAPGCEVGHVGVCDDTPIADGETGDLFEGDGPALDPLTTAGSDGPTE